MRARAAASSGFSPVGSGRSNAWATVARFFIVRVLVKIGQQAVVVALRDRVELVVVAAGAAERQPEDRLAERVELLVGDVHLHLLLVRLGQQLRPEDQEAGRGQPVRVVGRVRQQVAGDLLAEELVVRLVAR